MSKAMAMPLLLELSQPVNTASYRQDWLKEGLDTGESKYNPQTQVKENSKGGPQYSYIDTSSLEPNGSEGYATMIDDFSSDDSGLPHIGMVSLSSSLWDEARS